MQKLGIVIATHVNYMHITLPVLLPTLPRNIPHVIYISGATKYKNNENIVHVPYNAFEYTPIIEQANNPTFEYVHLLHDTTTVGTRYPLIIQEYATYGVDCVCNTSYCGMWIYKTSALAQHSSFLNSLRGITKKDAIKHEGFFHKYKLGSCEIVYDDLACDFVERDIYNTGSKRITEYHSAFDLYKYKANYGQKGSSTFNEA